MPPYGCRDALLGRFFDCPVCIQAQVALPGGGGGDAVNSLNRVLGVIWACPCQTLAVW